MNKIPKAFSLMPGPKFPESLPFIGCKDILRGKKEFYEHVHEYYDRFGPICKIKLLGKEIVLLSSSEGFKEIFDQCRPYPNIGPVTKNMEYYKRKIRPELFRDSMGLVVTGPEWAEVRTIFNPILMQPNSELNYLKGMTQISRELANICDDLVDKNGKLPDNFHSYIQRWAQENAAFILLGHRFHCVQAAAGGHTQGDKMVKHAATMAQLMKRLGDTEFFWYNLGLSKVWPDWRKFDKAFLEYKDIIDETIEKTKDRMREGDGETGDMKPGVLEQAYQSTGLDSQKPAGFMYDTLLGTVETTSNSTGFLLYHLATNQRCQDELVRRMENKSYQDYLKELTNPRTGYLYACLRESQRLLPPTLGTVRVPDRDVVVEGYTIPPGVEVLICNQINGRVAFQRPNEFIPERWLKGDESPGSSDKFVDISKEHHPLSLPTFGHGPRMCVGVRVARLEIFVLMLQMFSRYKLTWEGEEMGIKSHGVNNPNQPLAYTLTKRSQPLANTLQ